MGSKFKMSTRNLDSVEVLGLISISTSVHVEIDDILVGKGEEG
jgi:hypothetical protein